MKTRRGAASPLLLFALLLASLLPGACATAPAEGAKPARHRHARREHRKGESPEEVAAALKRAEAAFLAGRFGEAVVEANKVMEGSASPDEYYAAVKIVGLASCNRKDARPVAFAFGRLQPDDQEGLRRECALNGLSISADGKVTVGAAP